MSKYIDELVEDIKTNPTTWVQHEYTGLRKENVAITNFGNGVWWFFGWGTSVCTVTINGREERTTWADKYNLEEIFIWWMEQVSLNELKQMK